MANGNQISTSVTILNSLLGYQGISLTNFTTSAVSSIAAGSKIEIAGAFFSYSADDLPNASSWTAITTATTAYLALMPSGTAGSQIISASWLSYAPTWQTAKQGWYASTASLLRVVASAYKSGATSQEEKKILTMSQDTNNRVYFNNVTTVGTIISQLDTTYLLSATCGSIILPAAPIAGQKITFKNKGNYTNIISANTAQNIGTTTSVAFILYAQEDYVTLEYDGVSIWYVVATNGPVKKLAQGSTVNLSSGLNNLLSTSMNPGVYDIECDGTISISGTAYCIPFLNGMNTGVEFFGAGVRSLHLSYLGFVNTTTQNLGAFAYGYFGGGGTAAMIYDNSNDIPIAAQVLIRRVG